MIANVPVFIVSQDLIITHWNHLMQHIVGYSAREVVNKKCYDIVCGRNADGTCFCRKQCPLIVATEADFPSSVFISTDTKYTGIQNLRVEYVLLPGVYSLLHIVTIIPKETTQRLTLPLTNRQLEVLECLASGLRVRQVAKLLHITEDTTRTHIKAILTSLDVHSQQEAIAKFYRSQISLN